MTEPGTTHAYDRLPEAVTELFGEDATAEYAYDLLTVDVPPGSWIAALETARDLLGCTYFDWLSAVDEPGTGFRVCAHVAALAEGSVRRLMLRTTVPHDAAVLPSAIDVYAGAAWHERETHEMFGIGFEGHPHLVPLLLPEGFEGYPLRKDFVLAARVAKAWPGAKEPGESEHGGPKRRTMLPPGVPDPNEWGPLKGQLPPAPARPTRAARPAGDRPVRRARSVSEGSAGQRAEAAAPAATESAPAGATPRRARSASQGSASQQGAPAATGPAASGPAATSPTPGAPTPDAPTPDAPKPGAPETASAEPATGARPEPAAPGSAPKPRSADAPWHHARPAFDSTPETENPVREGAGGGPETPRGGPATGGTGPAEATEPTTAGEPAEATEPPEAGEPAEATEPPEAGEPADTSAATEPPGRSERPATPDRPETPDQPETPDRPAGGDTA
ncbi:NADH-quinone oxidoreductase subunit C [Streptomyces sp. NPDC058231]|uniref:NADH-quinone oxidoreductase subunit C n=1 Tax=Streptomyces sp. NPDC058231 TaxID=3346392 RepID=UPI0036E8D4FC